MSAHERPPAADHLTVLATGEVEVVGRLPWSSNGTFLVTCRAGDVELPAVYKPERGERPLWDFPGGIFRREVAMYVVSDFLGWDLVPETLVRVDAPYGIGSLQRFVDADFSQHYFTLIDQPATHGPLRTMAALDVAANNTDRKSGHCLLGRDGAIWGIDNGLCFHPIPKLRTVIWDFAGEPIAPAELEALARLADGPPAELGDLLSVEEIDAVADRAADLVDAGCLPDPDPDRHHYPWPLV